MKTLQERFEEKVDYDGPINPKTGTRCHIWTGAKSLPQRTAKKLDRFAAESGEDGYGKIRVGSLTRLAHRVAWELYTGPIPDGYQIDHDNEIVGCSKKSCVNVEHLRPTATNNRRRSNNSSGEWAIYWASLDSRWRVTIQINIDGKTRKFNPSLVGLPSSYKGEPPPAAPPIEAIEARDKLRAHLGLPE